jgi:hypothetical protein
MRESQMKKLVALAVAGAFVAPVYAADISVSGYFETSYIDLKTSSSTSKTIAEDANVDFTASAETANGIKVSAKIGIESDGTRNDGRGITLSGAFGKLVLGDTSGAVDSLDAADFANTSSLPGLGGRNDVPVAYTLPTMVPNLSVMFAYSPENGDSDELVGSTTDAVEGIAVKYNFGNGSIGFASEDAGTSSFNMLGFTYSLAGLDFAYDMNEGTAAGGAKTDYIQWSLQYGMGDLSLGLLNVSTQAAGSAKTQDSTLVGLYYDMGNGVSAYLESGSNDKGALNEETIVGVAFSF